MSRADKLQCGEVVLTGRATPSGDQWIARGEVSVRRMADARDVELPVEGVFETEQEAISAGVRAAMKWVDREFPIPK
jgi:hypothetical protein